MSPVKITALVLVFAGGIIGLFFAFNKNNFSPAPLIPDNFERNKFQKTVSAPAILNGKPLYWFEGGNEKTENKTENEIKNEAAKPVDEIKIEREIISLWQKIIVPIEPPPLSSQSFSSSLSLTVESDSPFISDGEMNIRADGAENSAEYYTNFIDSLKAIAFTDAEREAMGKDKDGMILLLEELLDEAIAENNLTALRLSFAGWRNLDEKVSAELAKMPISRKMAPTNRLLMGWYRYHSGIAKKLSEEELSQEQLKALREQFKKNAGIHNAGFRSSVASLKNSPNFAIFSIPEAQAVTCGAVVPPPFYHFGGRVITMWGCAQGIVETISPPCGGEILFLYPVLAANPYLYKKPTIGSEVLGRATFIPGVCISVPPIPYEATVLYFGSSLLP